MPTRRLLLSAILAVAMPLPALARAEVVTVFAAASLKNGLDAAARAFEAGTGTRVAISYAGSSALARQIEAGAPADLFLSADTDWMDHLAGKDLIRADSRINLLGNSLVLVGAQGVGAPGVTGPLDLTPGAPLPALLPELLGDGRMAVALTAAVPAGKYAKAALEHLGLWDGVKDRLAEAENVRAALALVARGEARLGIVYATDAKAEPKVTVLATFPAGSHPPIVYPAALTRTAGAGAAEFLRFLSSPAATAAFEAQGFSILARAS